MKYAEYMKSPEWKRLRAEARERANGKCEFCGAGADAVHHVAYPKGGFHEDGLENLVVVCESCHMKSHGIRGHEMTNAMVLNFEGKALVASQMEGEAVFRFRDAFDALEYGEVTHVYKTFSNSMLPQQVYSSAWGRLPEQCKKEIREEIDGTHRIVHYVTEKGLYRMAMNSSSEKADRFQDWLADVCMSIRQHGCYPPPEMAIAPKTPSEMLLMAATQLVEHERQISVLENRVNALEESKQEILDSIARTVASPGFLTVRQQMLMMKINPEQLIGNEPAKKVVGGYARRIGNELGVKPAKIMEGTYEVNAWPANVIERAISAAGLH
jgi:prophage antirepressor-like protein